MINFRGLLACVLIGLSSSYLLDLLQWLFDCLAEWKYLDEDAYRYVSLSKPAAKASAGPAAATSGKDADETVDLAENHETRVSTSDKTSSSTDTTPAGGRQRSAKNGRFDVDELLTELDHTTPQDKKDGAAAADADAQAKDDTKPAANDVACLLFDTPSKTMSARKTRGGRDGGADPKEPEPEADDQMEEPKSDATSKSKQSRGSTGSKKSGKKSADLSPEEEGDASSLNKKDQPTKKATASSKKVRCVEAKMRLWNRWCPDKCVCVCFDMCSRLPLRQQDGSVRRLLRCPQTVAKRRP